jgi:hypothetical protein
MAYEKNIAALLREDSKTIRVTFNPNRYETEWAKGQEHAQEKLYNYVTHFDVAVGDSVLVEAAGQLKVVTVVNIDDGVKIEPGADYALRWVIMKIDLTEHNANMARNEEIETMVKEAYQKNLRRSFAQQILSGVDDSARDNLQKLLGAS